MKESLDFFFCLFFPWCFILSNSIYHWCDLPEPTHTPCTNPADSLEVCSSVQLDEEYLNPQEEAMEEQSVFLKEPPSFQVI